MRKASLTRAFILIALYSVAVNFAHPVTPALIQNLGLPDYMFGVAFASMAITNFLFSPFWGKFSEQYGSTRTMSIGLLGYAVGQFVFMVSKSELSIIVGRMIAGLFMGGCGVNIILYVSKHSSLKKRAYNLTIATTLNVAFGPFGYLLGGYIGDYSIRLTFITQIISVILIALAYLLFLTDDDVDKKDTTIYRLIMESNPLNVFKLSAQLISNYLLVFFIVVALGSFAATGYEQCFNYFIMDQFGFPPSYNGLLRTAVGFTALIVNSTICLWILRKTDLSKSLMFLLLVSSLAMGVIVSLNQVLPFIIANILFFGINAIREPLLQAILTEKGDTNNGILIGIYNSMKSLGMVSGSLFAGFIYVVGPRLSFVSAFVVFGLAGALAYINYKQGQGSALPTERL